jgi:hypothetical protein
MWPEDPITIFGGPWARAAPPATDNDGEAGFGLIDTLIALAAVSTLLAIMPHAVLGSGQLIARSEAGIGAAQTLRMVVATELSAGQATAVRLGQVAGRSWRASTRTVELARAGETQAETVLETTLLTIALDAGRTVTIEGLSVGREP